MTSLELEDLLYRKVNDFLIENGSPINGKVFKKGMRITDSKPNSNKEDAVVGVLTGKGGELQKGTCYVNVYVPNKMVSKGRYLEDKQRCLTISKLLDALPAYLRKGESVYFSKTDMIVTLEEPQLNEHFVSLKLEFKVLQNY